MSNPTSKTGTVLLFLFLFASANTFADAMLLEHTIRDACSDRHFAQVDVQACIEQNADRSETVWQNAKRKPSRK
jgi:hypothetical protein